MEVKAIAKYVRVQPRKVRIIADEVRGNSALYVSSQLRYHTSKSAHALRKVLISAIANAAENHQIPAESLRIAAITVDEGPRLKRIQARAMGRGNRILKKTSHITVVVSDDLVVNTTKPKGTKAKARPTFGATKGRKPAAAVAAPVTEEATPVVASEAPEEETVTPVVETTGEATASEDQGAQ